MRSGILERGWPTAGPEGERAKARQQSQGTGAKTLITLEQRSDSVVPLLESERESTLLDLNASGADASEALAPLAGKNLSIASKE